MADKDDDYDPVSQRLIDRHKEIWETYRRIPFTGSKLEYIGSLLATERDREIRRDLYRFLASTHLHGGNGEAAKVAALACVKEFPDWLSVRRAGFIFAMEGDAAGALKYFSEAYRMTVEEGAFVTDALLLAAHTLAVNKMPTQLDAFLELVVATAVVRGKPDCVMDWDWIEPALGAGASAALIDKLKLLFGLK